MRYDPMTDGAERLPKNDQPEEMPLFITSLKIVLAVFLAIFWAFIFGLLTDFVQGKKVFLNEFNNSDPFSFHFYGVAVCMSLGYGMYLFKKKWQLAYGIFEITFACIAGISALDNYVSNKSNPFGNVASIMGVVYFVQRGFGNTYEALDKIKNKKSQPVALKLPIR